MSYDLERELDTRLVSTLSVGDLYRTRRGGDILRLRKYTRIADGRVILHGRSEGGITLASTAIVALDDVVFRP